MEEKKNEGPWILSCGHSVADINQPHYCRYLSLEQLMALIKPNAGAFDERDFANPDEHLFIVVHQMMEFGFEQAVSILTYCIPAVLHGDYEKAIQLLERLTGWMGVFSKLTLMLKTMKPEDFLKFRPLLAGTSGAESLGFRRLEILSGRTPNSPYMAGKTYHQVLDREVGTAKGQARASWWTEELKMLSEESSLRSAWMAKLQQANLTLADLSALSIDHPLCRLARALYHYDVGFKAFYSAHLEVAEFQIGRHPGTGDTEGVPYLEQVLKNIPFFPELWPEKKS